MAGDWIKFEKSTLAKPEILRIASILKISRHHAIGLCLAFWSWCDDQLAECHAPSVTTLGIDDVVGVTGFASALIEVGWLRDRQGSLEVPHFDRHLSESAKKRGLSAKRQEKRRHADVTQMSRSQRDECVTREEKRREEKKRHTMREAPADATYQPPHGLHDPVAAPAAANKIAKVFREVVRCPHPEGEGKGFLSQMLMHEIWDVEQLIAAVRNYGETCEIRGTQLRFRLSLLKFFRDEFRSYLPGEYTRPAQEREPSDSGTNKGQSRMAKFLEKVGGQAPEVEAKHE